MSLDSMHFNRLLDLTRGAVDSTPTVLSQGQISPYKVDLGKVVDLCDFQYLLGLLVPKFLYEHGFRFVDAFGGPDSGAYPIALAIVHGFGALPARQKCHAFRISKKGELLGDHRIKSGTRVALVDDVVTTGTGLCLSAEAIRKVGGEVVGAFVVVDREEGGQERLAAHGIKLARLFRASDIL